MPSVTFRFSLKTEHDIELIQYLESFSGYAERRLWVRQVLTDAMIQQITGEQNENTIDIQETLDTIKDEISKLAKSVRDLEKTGVHIVAQPEQSIEVDLSKQALKEIENNLSQLFNKNKG